MKKYLIVVLITLPTLITKCQSDYIKYPNYETVVTRFFEKYSVIDRPNKTYITEEIKFEKRPTGWHIVVFDNIPNQKIVKDELFWDRQDRTYKSINFKELRDISENKDHIKKYQNHWSKKYYSICPYYGYKGWDRDVIHDFEKRNNLPDTTIYALGRAYSSCASNLLSDNTGFADSSYQFKLASGRNSMTNEQLKEYRYYRHRAINTYKKLAQINPKFHTIVGSIGIKASNEYMTSFLDLRMYQNEQEASKEVVDGLYNDFFISTAKNFLNTCAPNAILFTNGDNDTYPLLYVQKNFGFRTDILVVNVSLLQTDRYINSLRNKILDAAGLPLSLLPEEIQGRKRDLIIVEKSDDKVPDLLDLIKFIKNDEHIKPYGETDYYYILSNKYRLNRDKETVEGEINRSYFFRNHLIILDVLATNNWKRPLYYSVTTAKEYYLGLNAYLQSEGMAYQLTSTKKANSDKQSAYVNTKLMYDNLMNKFDWSGIKKDNSDIKQFCTNYRYSFHQLAESLISSNKQDSAKLILDKCVELFPDEIVYYDFSMLFILEDYYKIDDIEEGNKMAKKIAYNLNNVLYRDIDLTIAKNKNRKGYEFKMLEYILKKYEQDDLLE